MEWRLPVHWTQVKQWSYDPQFWLLLHGENGHPKEGRDMRQQRLASVWLVQFNPGVPGGGNFCLNTLFAVRAPFWGAQILPAYRVNRRANAFYGWET